MVVDDAGALGSDEFSVTVESFAAFYEAEYRRMVRLAVALVGRRDVAEELVQDAFLTLHAGGTGSPGTSRPKDGCDEWS
jgi:DNA-directed RNA polymerase specialized sigma24 family protein